MTSKVHPCRLRLLGFWSLDVGPQRVHVGSREQRVLSLVALRGRRRGCSVAGTLWPDSTEARARASLRTSLKRLRALDGLVSSGEHLGELGWRVTVDVWELFHCLERVERMRRTAELDLPEVLATLDGPVLLPDWFDDWVLVELTACTTAGSVPSSASPPSCSTREIPRRRSPSPKRLSRRSRSSRARPHS